MLSRLGSSLWSGAAAVMSQRSMRPVVRALSDVHVALYRVSGGRAQAPRHPTLLLRVTGRKTGKERTVPLVYIEDGDDVIVAAAYAGSDRDPDWWLNLSHAPSAVVETRGVSRPVVAAVVQGPERDDLWRRLVAMYAPFADYQKRTTRQIPVIRLRPQ